MPQLRFQSGNTNWLGGVNSETTLLRKNVVWGKVRDDYSDFSFETRKLIFLRRKGSLSIVDVHKIDHF